MQVLDSHLFKVCSRRRLADDEPRVGEALKHRHYMGEG